METMKFGNPALMPTGEIRFEDGTSILVPQPVKFIQVSSTALREAYLETIPNLPSHEEVLRHASSNAKPLKEPIWARVCAHAGGVLLVVVGLFFVALGVYLKLS